MEIVLLKQSGQIKPCNASSEDFMRNWKEGKFFVFETTTVRNPDYHNLIFGLGRIAVEDAEEDSYWHNKTAHSFVKAVQLTYDIECEDALNMRTGEITRVPKTLSMAKMTQEKFQLIGDKMFFEVAKRIKVDEGYLREHYKEIFDARRY